MDSKFFALAMMALFWLVLVVGKVLSNLFFYRDTGIRLSTKLRTASEVMTSVFLLGVVVAQSLLTYAFAYSYIDVHIIFGTPGIAVGLVLCAIGIVLASYSQYAMGDSWRIGVDPDEKIQLVTTGIYSVVRNPIYSACIIHGIGIVILAPHIAIFLTGIIGYFVIRAYVKEIEEPYLLEIHGSEYISYLKSTGSFFPKISVLRSSLDND